MNTQQITELIIQEIGLPEWHQHRATLQVWFELMKTWREYGEPKELTLNGVVDASIRCVDKLVGDHIIEDRSSLELHAQLTIVRVICETRNDYTG